MSNTKLLGEITDTSVGIQESPDKLNAKHLISQNNPGFQIDQGVFVLSKEELKILHLSEIENMVIKNYLDPNDVNKYHIIFREKYLIYSNKFFKEKIKIEREYQNLKQHLDIFKPFITSSNKPYGLHRPRNQKYFDSPKIIFKNMFVNVGFAYDRTWNYYFGFSFSSIIQKDKTFDLKYIIAILNSKFAETWFYKNGKIRGAGVDIGVQKLRLFPIKVLSFTEQKIFIEIVDKILTITDSDDYLQSETKQSDVIKMENEIDQMVYKLYGLTSEENAIVEGKK